MRTMTAIVAIFITVWLSPASASEPFAEGPKKCQECHEAEYDVWKETPHAKSYKKIHKTDKAKAIVAAIGVKSMKKAKECQLCHYTLIPKEVGAKAKAKAGPSCESCHGPSSDWRAIHNDYGGANATAETESTEHKQLRLQTAKDAGMIWSFMHYDTAAGCMDCHGLAHPDLEADTLITMLDAGHPVKPEFELVQYSQGTVRHRFYPPDVSTNSVMSGVELARYFVTGQAAKLVSAIAALKKSDHTDYVTTQTKRAEMARKALAAVTSVPEAAALLAQPTEENARKLVDAIKDTDLSTEVGHLLPDPNSYK